MRTSVGLILAGVGMCLCPAYGQTMSFVREFITGWSGAPNTAVADATGIYLIGNRCGSGPPRCQTELSRYDFNGNELWTRAFTSPSGLPLSSLRASASDGTGLYVHGEADPPGPHYQRTSNATKTG
jgi:hypothetical protein